MPGQLNENGKNAVDFLKCQYLIDQIDIEQVNGEKSVLPHFLPGFLAQYKIVIGVPYYKRESGKTFFKW